MIENEEIKINEEINKDENKEIVIEQGDCKYILIKVAEELQIHNEELNKEEVIDFSNQKLFGFYSILTIIILTVLIIIGVIIKPIIGMMLILSIIPGKSKVKKSNIFIIFYNNIKKKEFVNRIII